MDVKSLHELANRSIRRGCGFALLAIWTFMVGMMGEPAIAARAGAILVTLAAVILLLKANNAQRRRYSDTELWIMAGARLEGYPKDRLQQLIGGVLEERYRWHAQLGVRLAFAMWLIVLAMWLVAS